MSKFRNRIHLKNRYGLKHYLQFFTAYSNVGIYRLVVDSKTQYVRTGCSDGALDFLDPEGGPFIQKGASIGRFIVKEIRMVNDTYLLTLGV